MGDLVQGGMFGGLNWKPLDNDAPFGPPAPAMSGTTLSTASNTLKETGTALASAGKSAGIKGASIVDTSTGAAGGSNAIGGLLTRAVVVILGFVFVAVGLTMFRPQAILQKVAR